jgi:hypothetical protein
MAQGASTSLGTNGIGDAGRTAPFALSKIKGCGRKALN